MTLTSQYDGKCPNGHSWKKGDQIYYSKTPKAICIDQACFESQKNPQGTLSSATESPKPQNHDKFTQSVINSNLAWDYAVKKAKEIMYGKVQSERDLMILTQVLFKAVIELMK